MASIDIMNLLNYIAGIETKGSDSDGYNSSNRGTLDNTVIGIDHNTKRGDKSLDEMTIGEIKKLQQIKDPNNVERLFAAGRYQITPPTMLEALAGTGIKDEALFNIENQTKLGSFLLMEKRKLAKDWFDGSIKKDQVNKVAKALSQEWAGLPMSDNKSAYESKVNTAGGDFKDFKNLLMKAHGTMSFSKPSKKTTDTLTSKDDERIFDLLREGRKNLSEGTTEVQHYGNGTGNVMSILGNYALGNNNLINIPALMGGYGPEDDAYVTKEVEKLLSGDSEYQKNKGIVEEFKESGIPFPNITENMKRKDALNELKQRDKKYFEELREMPLNQKIENLRIHYPNMSPVNIAQLIDAQEQQDKTFSKDVLASPTEEQLRLGNVPFPSKNIDGRPGAMGGVQLDAVERMLTPRNETKTGKLNDTIQLRSEGDIENYIQEKVNEPAKEGTLKHELLINEQGGYDVVTGMQLALDESSKTGAILSNGTGKNIAEDFMKNVSERSGQLGKDKDGKKSSNNIMKWIEENLGFNKKDAYRFLLYYAGGRLTDGSHAGSLRWAGAQVLNDVRTREKAQITAKGSIASNAARSINDLEQHFNDTKFSYTTEGRKKISAILKMALTAPGLNTLGSLQNAIADTNNRLPDADYIDYNFNKGQGKTFYDKEKGSGALFVAFPAKGQPGVYYGVDAVGNKTGQFRVGKRYMEMNTDILTNDAAAMSKYASSLFDFPTSGSLTALQQIKADNVKRLEKYMVKSPNDLVSALKEYQKIHPQNNEDIITKAFRLIESDALPEGVPLEIGLKMSLLDDDMIKDPLKSAKVDEQTMSSFFKLYPGKDTRDKMVEAQQTVVAAENIMGKLGLSVNDLTNERIFSLPSRGLTDEEKEKAPNTVVPTIGEVIGVNKSAVELASEKINPFFALLYAIRYGEIALEKE